MLVVKNWKRTTKPGIQQFDYRKFYKWFHSGVMSKEMQVVEKILIIFNSFEKPVLKLMYEITEFY